MSAPWLLLALLAASPPSLRGIDTVPAVDVDALSDDDEAALIAVAFAAGGEDGPTVVRRARAIRLLGRRRSPRVGEALSSLSSSSSLPGPLRAQVVVARAEHAFVSAADQVAAAAAARAVAGVALDDDNDDAAAAAVTVLFFVGGPEAKEALGAAKVARPSLRGAIEGRLRQWGRAGSWTARRAASTRTGAGSSPSPVFAPDQGDVLQRRHGDPAPPR